VAEAILEAHSSEYTRSTELAADAPLELVPLRHHLEVLADALVADAPLELVPLRHHLEVLADALAAPGNARLEPG
jgi:hypothetical protein